MLPGRFLFSQTLSSILVEFSSKNTDCIRVVQYYVQVEISAIEPTIGGFTFTEEGFHSTHCTKRVGIFSGVLRKEIPSAKKLGELDLVFVTDNFEHVLEQP